MVITQSTQQNYEKINKNVIIKAENLRKVYNGSQVKTVALNDVSIEIFEGEFVAIIGSSGSGKSTLLHLLAGLDKPSKQQNQSLEFQNISLLGRSESFLANFRAKNIGFVLQFFGLLPTLTSLENVMISAYFGGINRKKRRKAAESALCEVNLDHRFNHYPNQMSGGEKQRVAIARALVNNPSVLFADEPTGNLDSKSGKNILELLKKLNNEYNLTSIIVTHDMSVLSYADRVIEILDGKIVRDEYLPNSIK